MSNKLFKDGDQNPMMKTYDMRESIEKALDTHATLSDARFEVLDKGIGYVGYAQAHIQYTYEGDEYVIVLKKCSGKELGGHWVHSKCASGGPPKI